MELSVASQRNQKPVGFEKLFATVGEEKSLFIPTEKFHLGKSIMGKILEKTLKLVASSTLKRVLLEFYLGV